MQSSNTDATLIDIGTIWACNDYPVTIPVINNAPAELEIVDFHPSCSCTRISPDRLTIPGGKSRSFQVWIDLASYRPEQYQVPTRTTEIGIQAETSESLEGGMFWTLRATVRNAIGLPPFVMIDRPVVIGGDPPKQSVQSVVRSKFAVLEHPLTTSENRQRAIATIADALFVKPRNRETPKTLTCNPLRPQPTLRKHSTFIRTATLNRKF